MSLVKTYKQFKLNTNAIEQAFSAFEATGVTDTADFRSMLKTDEMSGEMTSERVDGGETVIVRKVSSGIHPAPVEFSAEEISADNILRFFHYSHLPEKLQERSRPFCELARRIIDTTPRNPERTVALRKLLEAKDAAVRAAV